MATLAPMIGGDIAVNQPTQPVGNALTTLLDVFTDPRSTPTRKGPTEKEKTGVYLSGLSKELGKLKENYDAGNLTAEQFNTKSRGLRRAALTEMPEYSSEITGLFEDFGFTKETPMKTARDVANEQFNSVTAREDFQLDFAIVKDKNPNLSDGKLIELAYSRNISRRANQQIIADIELGKQVNWVEVEDVYVGQTKDMSTTLGMLIDDAQQDQILSPDEAIQIQKFYDENLRGLRKPTGVRDEEWNSFQDNYVKPMNVIVDAAIGVAGERGIDKWTSRAVKEIFAVAVSQGKLQPDILTMLTANTTGDIASVLRFMGQRVKEGNDTTWKENYDFVLGASFDDLLNWVTEFKDKNSIEDLYAGPKGTAPTKEDFSVWDRKSSGAKANDLLNSPGMISAAGSPANKAVAIYNLYSKLDRTGEDVLTPSMLSSIFNETHYKALEDIYKENSLIGMELATKAIEAIGSHKEKIDGVINSMADQAGLSIRERKLYPDYEKADPNVRAWVDLHFRGDFNEFISKKGVNPLGMTNTGVAEYFKAVDEIKKQLDLMSVFDKNSKLLQKKYFPKEVLEAGEGVGGGGGTGELKGSAGVDIIKESEGYSETAYWDVNAWRAGYGSDTTTLSDGTVVKIAKDTIVTREDSERDLARRRQEFATAASRKVGLEVWSELPTNVTEALTSIAYNYGSIPDRLMDAIKSKDREKIASAVEALGDDNDGINRARRYREAAMIRGELSEDRSRSEPSAAPTYTDRPRHRGEGSTLAVSTSSRPRNRGETEAAYSARVEGTSGGKASQRATQGLSERTVAMLTKVGVDPAGVKQFTSEEELQAAVSKGEVSEGDYVAVGQEVFQL